MPWLFLKYGLPLISGLGLVWAVKYHFDEHQRLQFDNTQLSQAVEAKDAAITRYRDEIRRRDSILARREMAYRKLSQRLRVAESVVTQSDDLEVIAWRNTRLPAAVIDSLREISGNNAGSHQADTTTNIDE